MSSKRNLVIGVMVIAVCGVVMMAALARTKVNNVAFAELASKQQDERCEVYGILDASSIKSIKGATTVQFALVEDKTGRRLNVLYDNPSIRLPATFPAASHAKVSGTYNAGDQQFIGDTAVTKCPSKYDGKTELDLVQKEAVNKWQKAIGHTPEAGS